jgi:hypothetical protein
MMTRKPIHQGIGPVILLALLVPISGGKKPAVASRLPDMEVVAVEQKSVPIYGVCVVEKLGGGKHEPAKPAPGTQALISSPNRQTGLHS